jgi:hypothetical protein
MSVDPRHELGINKFGFTQLYGLGLLLGDVGRETFRKQFLLDLPALLPLDRDPTDGRPILARLGPSGPEGPNQDRAPLEARAVSKILGSGWLKLFPFAGEASGQDDSFFDTWLEEDANRLWFDEGLTDNTDSLYEGTAAILVGSAGFPSALPYEVTVGRDLSCDIVLLFSTISSRHALFVRDEEGWHIVDRDSRNGTFLNEERLPPWEEHPLADGDLVRFGRGFPLLYLVADSFVSLLVDWDEGE